MTSETIEDELVRLRKIEVRYNILVGEMAELRDKLNTERLRAANLKDSLDGMSTDMSLMEDQIRELSGRPA